MLARIAGMRAAMRVTSDGDGRLWSVQPDLLGSNGQAADYVVETDNDASVLLRFGDGVNGRSPGATEGLSLRMRGGNGSNGNVGSNAIAHVLCGFDGITRVRNPLPARGGTGPTPLARARMDAPQAFRRQERAVTPQNYADMAMRDTRVQRAVATRRWTGSWYTMFITVDRRGGAPVDAPFEDSMTAFIDRYRLAGHDVEIDAPAYVALDIALHVCALPGYFTADVERRLLQVFGSAQGGFFDPDRFSFGDPVYLSAVVAAAMAVTGVSHVEPLRFQRLGRAPAGEITAGQITMARLEIARGYLALAFPLGTLGLLMGRVLWRRRVRSRRHAGECLTSVLAIGDRDAIAVLATELMNDPGDGYVVVGAGIPGEPGARGDVIMVGDRAIPIFGDENDALGALGDRCAADLPGRRSG